MQLWALYSLIWSLPRQNLVPLVFQGHSHITWHRGRSNNERWDPLFLWLYLPSSQRGRRPFSSRSTSFCFLPSLDSHLWLLCLLSVHVCVCVCGGETAEKTSLLFKNSQIRHSAKVTKEWDALPVVQRPGNSFVFSSILRFELPLKYLFQRSHCYSLPFILAGCFLWRSECWSFFCETPWNTGEINILLFLWLSQNVF